MVVVVVAGMLARLVSEYNTIGMHSAILPNGCICKKASRPTYSTWLLVQPQLSLADFFLSYTCNVILVELSEC
jgi:hypothetical protein